MKHTEKIEELRMALREIDLDILKLIEKRVEASVKIQDKKAKANLPSVDLGQENLIQKSMAQETLLESKEELEKVYQAIIDLSKKEFQNKKLNK